MATQTQVYSIVFSSEAATRNAQQLGETGIDTAAKMDALSASIEGLTGDLKRLANVRTPKISLPKIPDIPRTQKTGLMHSLGEIGEGFERLSGAINDIPGMESIGRVFQVLGAGAQTAAVPLGAVTLGLAALPAAGALAVGAILGVVSATAKMAEELKAAGRADLISERQFAQLAEGKTAIDELINEGKQLAVTFGAELAPVGTAIAKYLGDSLREAGLELADLLEQFSLVQRYAAIVSDMTGGFVMEAVTGDSIGVRIRAMAAETKAISERIRAERAAQRVMPEEITVIGEGGKPTGQSPRGGSVGGADPFSQLAAAFGSSLSGLDSALKGLAERQAAEAGRTRAAQQTAAAAFTAELRETQEAMGALAEDVRAAGPAFKAAAREAALGMAGGVANALSSGTLEGLLAGTVPVVGEPLAEIVSLLRNFDKVIPALIKDIIAALPDIVIGVVKGIMRLPFAFAEAIAEQFARLFRFLAPGKENTREQNRALQQQRDDSALLSGIGGGMGMSTLDLMTRADQAKSRQLRNNAESMRGSTVNVTNIGEIKPDLARKLASAIRTSSGGYGGVGV